ncbi:MAG: glycosyltransferase family 2 protein [Rhodoferax sp.]|uniref:glycosyltransferase family 2 protein n=1 Tax=Rhodoferax sp. TaxID=50421 RepID=UPI003BB601B0
MKPNSHLSFVIPTYNRAEFLDCCLSLIIPSAKKFNIEIYISDNFSGDNTREVVSRKSKEYPLVKYFCNLSNLGADENFRIALGLPRSDYIWLLGDTYQIKPESIDFLINFFLNEKFSADAIVFNVAKRVNNIINCDYFDRNKLLRDLGWHMTCMSSLVYSRRLILAANFDRYRNTNFIQTGIIFEYIENKDFFIKWVGDQSVFPILVKDVAKNSWQDRTFEIWMNKWSNFIFSLAPSYDLNVKLDCIKDHGLKSGLFSVKGLLFLRGEGILNLVTFWKFRYIFPLVIHSSILTVFLISLMPKFIPKIIKNIFHK